MPTPLNPDPSNLDLTQTLELQLELGRPHVDMSTVTPETYQPKPQSHCLQALVVKDLRWDALGFGVLGQSLLQCRVSC